jgi:hypothetical protein
LKNSIPYPDNSLFCYTKVWTISSVRFIPRGEHQCLFMNIHVTRAAKNSRSSFLEIRKSSAPDAARRKLKRNFPSSVQAARKSHWPGRHVHQAALPVQKVPAVPADKKTPECEGGFLISHLLASGHYCIVKAPSLISLYVPLVVLVTLIV